MSPLRSHIGNVGPEMAYGTFVDHPRVGQIGLNQSIDRSHPLLPPLSERVPVPVAAERVAHTCRIREPKM